MVNEMEMASLTYSFVIDLDSKYLRWAIFVVWPSVGAQWKGKNK